MTYRPRNLIAASAAGGLALLALPAAGLGAAGIDWQMRTSPGGTGPLVSAAYGNGTFVAIGEGPNQVITSTDGVTWTPRSLGTIGANWVAVTYGGGQFVATACDGNPSTAKVMTSPDGISWTLRNASSNTCWGSVAYGAGRYVAGSPFGDMMSSTDGITWTAGSSPGAQVQGVAHGASGFVAVANNAPYVQTSPTGTAWTAQSAHASAWGSVAHGNGQYVAVSSSPGDDRGVMSSVNGRTWIRGFEPGGADRRWAGVTHGSGLFVAVAGRYGGQADVMTSPNGITWTDRNAPDRPWTAVTYGGGMFVAVGQGGEIMTSGTYTPPPTAPPTTGAATTPGATPPSVGACADTFYQQAGRTIAWNKKRQAYRVVSRIRVFEDAPAACRTKLSMIYRSSKTKVSLAQKAGSTLGYRKLKGNFNAPVISWPNAKEMRFTTGDTTGQNRKNARLVLVSYLKKAKNMPKLNDIELVIVRRIPRDPRAAQSTANPLYGQKSTFGRTRAWAGVS